MSKPKSTLARGKSARNSLYLKIGKRIRQARLMARESNSRDLSVRLGWSAGRVHNYEAGLSTPGVEETLQLADALRVDPAWLTYGVGAPRPAALHSSRYRRLLDAVDDAEKQGNLPDLLQALRLPLERLQKFRKNPYSKIPDLMARRCEKYLGQRRGWIDEPLDRAALSTPLTPDVEQLLELYDRLKSTDKAKLQAIGKLLLE